MNERTTSRHLYRRASRHIPGGVNSPVRAFTSVGGTPIFFTSAQGARLHDADGNEFIDLVGSWGPMILGHSNPQVIAAIREQAGRATSFGAPCELEVRMAEKLCALVPALESVRMVSSGTEAAMSAIRLARAATGRSRILKFNGCYHGHADSLLVEAGSGAQTLGIPSSPGVPEALAELTISLPFNDQEALKQTFATEGSQIAAVIIEPIPGNMNLVMPTDGFLPLLRQLCDSYSTLLIFDEIISGFRVALGGAQELFSIKPDLVLLGKIIGGGLPAGAFGGRADLMEQLAPTGPVYQAGTLSGNPLAMAAGLATLDAVQKPGFYEQLQNCATTLAEGLKARARTADIPLWIDALGGALGLLFADSAPHQLDDVTASNRTRYNAFFHAMLERGVYLPPSPYELLFISIAHGEHELETVFRATEDALQQIRLKSAL